MKRTVLSVLALSGALVLGACGSSTNETSTGSGSSSSSAAAQETKAPTARVGDTVDLKTIAEQSSAAVKAKGTAHMTMKTTGQGAGTIEADADYSGDSPKMVMTVDEAGESFQMVYLDKVMYMGADSFKEMTGGKKWLKIDPSGDDPMSQMMGPMLDQMESTVANPTEQLKDVEGAEAKVSKVENGLTTYQVTLTKEQLSAMVKKQSGLPGLTEEALKQVPDGVTYDMTLDAEGLPVTVDMDMGGEKMSITYSKWGEPVTVEAPPASEVGTFEMPTS
ncbi:hypothetical protein KMZ32_17660 [Phycicoccus sp. MAQZ13P-2]|uniref:hypothetical protein n=1 Tax=Phycicoccus mangrovi TaxID=2840470 RepID=UPI001BFFFE9F|nr:hypothetical protein [Phycicoccus mangrovi]MBT9256369.1 hypothetical protein [Phycicoccus mangrovi]MBT9275907.1 hypothetical protein [Phycicoccus mangrovi]